MEPIKLETEYKDLQIERMEGIFTEEGHEFAVAYTMKGNSSFVITKKQNIQKIEKEKLGFKIFGNNIIIEEIRELFKRCRSPVLFFANSIISCLRKNH